MSRRIPEEPPDAEPFVQALHVYVLVMHVTAAANKFVRVGLSCCICV